MRKATVIATCLISSGLRGSLEEVEHRVMQCFQEFRPESNFRDWNTDIDDTVANDIIKAAGSSSRINVERFISDLD